MTRVASIMLVLIASVHPAVSGEAATTLLPELDRNDLLSNENTVLLIEGVLATKFIRGDFHEAEFDEYLGHRGPDYRFDLRHRGLARKFLEFLESVVVEPGDREFLDVRYRVILQDEDSSEVVFYLSTCGQIIVRQEVYRPIDSSWKEKALSVIGHEAFLWRSDR